MTLAKEATLLEFPLDFDIGLDGLGFKSEGEVRLKAGLEWQLAFGVSKSKGFFVDTSKTDELKIFLEATTPGLNAQGELGFLKMDVRDNPADPSKVAGMLIVDFREPSGDGKLTIQEMLNASSFEQIVDARITATVDIRLKLATRLDENQMLPYITTDFELDWDFDSAHIKPATLLGQAPRLAFKM